MPLYHGKGAETYPRGPEIDQMLSDALKRAGFAGSRSKGIFVTLDREYALDYCRNGDPAGLSVAEPHPGATLSWVEGGSHMWNALHNWLYKVRYEGRVPRAAANLISDIQGDLGVLDVYLTRKRLRKQTDALADAFVRSLRIREVTVEADGSYEHLLDGFNGEIWVTGGCDLRPAPAPEASPAP